MEGDEKMMNEEEEPNSRLERELDCQFPKGHKSRGKALVLFAVAQMIIKDQQEALNIAIKEIARLRKRLGYDKK